MDLDGKFTGDKYPLCANLPSKHFLKKGAKYRLLGMSSSPELHVDPQMWVTDMAKKRFILQKPSKGTSLYTKLCNPASSGYCRYQNIVELDKDYACLGDECLVDTVRVIQVNPGGFYEYVRNSCIEQAFFNNTGKVVRMFDDKILCADPRRDIASCCVDGGVNYMHTAV